MELTFKMAKGYEEGALSGQKCRVCDVCKGLVPESDAHRFKAVVLLGESQTKKNWTFAKTRTYCPACWATVTEITITKSEMSPKPPQST